MDWEFKELGYSYDSLEPFIDKETMEIHHTKHYNAYLTKAMKALEGNKQKSVEEVLLTDLRDAVQNNAGGFYNHTIFWEILGKNEGKGPLGNVGKIIDNCFGNFDTFKEKFSTQAAGLFGSGWIWLVYDKVGNKVEILICNNQNHPLVGKIILFGLDVWEHAYYLKYQNKRPEYIEAFWNVVDWKKVENRYLTEKVFVLGQ